MSRNEAAPRAIALAGNPNVGKSSIFNALTGLHQHTGNWPGKTVAVAHGTYSYAAQRYAVTDLPGAYSLRTGSEEEHIAADYLRAHTDACVVAVCDATCLARSLALALQLMQRCTHVIVCVNLMDEAQARGIRIDLHALQTLLGVPVVGTCAGDTETIRRLRQTIRDVFDGYITLTPHLLERSAPADCVRHARQLAARVVQSGDNSGAQHSIRIDRILTGKYTGAAVFVTLLAVLFWLTLEGSNVFSVWLQNGFDWLQGVLVRACSAWPSRLADALINGVYATAARVTAVMLPPAAIFFFLFSVLEDAGYLPRAVTPCGNAVDGFRVVGIAESRKNDARRYGRRDRQESNGRACRRGICRVKRVYIQKSGSMKKTYAERAAVHAQKFAVCRYHARSYRVIGGLYRMSVHGEHKTLAYQIVRGGKLAADVGVIKSAGIGMYKCARCREAFSAVARTPELPCYAAYAAEKPKLAARGIEKHLRIGHAAVKIKRSFGRKGVNVKRTFADPHRKPMRGVPGICHYQSAVGQNAERRRIVFVGIVVIKARKAIIAHSPAGRTKVRLGNMYLACVGAEDHICHPVVADDSLFAYPPVGVGAFYFFYHCFFGVCSHFAVSFRAERFGAQRINSISPKIPSVNHGDAFFNKMPIKVLIY